MTLEPSGLAGRVSDYIESDRIVDECVTDRVHVQVYRVPGEEENLVEGGSAHDVVLRDAETKDGDRPIIESWRSFESAEDACVQALDLAEMHDAVVWDDIVELR